MLALLKHHMPVGVRNAARSVARYAERVLLWPVILWQVRGETLADKLVLVRSALAAPFLALRSLHQWQDPILLRDARVNVPGVGRFHLRAHTDDLWHVVPWRERSIIALMGEVLGPGDTFIDAGANIGVYTVLAARLVGPHGRVLSVEMMPDTAERLALHIRLNHLPNVTVVRSALNDSAGEMVTATVQKGKHGQATIAADFDRYGLGTPVQVLTTTLDSITRHLGDVRLMKIDVEGAELRALRGARSLLQRLGGVVYEARGWKQNVFDPVGHLLHAYGFALRELDGNNRMAERASGSG